MPRQRPLPVRRALFPPNAQHATPVLQTYSAPLLIRKRKRDGYFPFLHESVTSRNRKRRRFLLDRFRSYKNDDYIFSSPLDPNWTGYTSQEVDLLKASYPKRAYYGGPEYTCPRCKAAFWWRERVKSHSAITKRKMSSDKISLLSEVHDKQKSWNAIVLVSRLWQFRGGTDEGPLKHTDIIAIDKEGNHMYGQIPPEPAERFGNALEEGKVYLMRRFMCNPSKQAFRLVEAPYMMQFTCFSNATPQPGVEDEYPYCTYNLTSFTDIPTPGGPNPRFLDVIGRITAVTDIITVQSQHQANPSDTRTIYLQDKEGNEISLVLWGARAREFNAEVVRTASETNPVIAIFVATLPKIYRGVKGLSGSSACRWYINEDLPEINAFHESFDQLLVSISNNVPGQQAIVTTPIRDPPTEKTVQELLALDPFDNQRKQFLCTVTINRLGSDRRWWFLSCRKCHKTAYVSGSVYRCSDRACASTKAEATYCISTFANDGTAEAEFMFFEKAARAAIGKPLITLLRQKYPDFIEVHEIAQIGGADVALPVEISRLVSQKYRLVVSISNKSFQPTSMQLSFQVGRIDHTFQPELGPLEFKDPSPTITLLSSPVNTGKTLPVPTNLLLLPPCTPGLVDNKSADGLHFLAQSPITELNTPLSAFKEKGKATSPIIPGKTPCSQKIRRKIFSSPLKIKESTSAKETNDSPPKPIDLPRDPKKDEHSDQLNDGKQNKPLDDPVISAKNKPATSVKTIVPIKKAQEDEQGDQVADDKQNKRALTNAELPAGTKPAVGGKTSTSTKKPKR